MLSKSMSEMNAATPRDKIAPGGDGANRGDSQREMCLVKTIKIFLYLRTAVARQSIEKTPPMGSDKETKT